MTITIKGNLAHIKTPYNRDFIDKIKGIGGRWDSNSKTWSVGVDEIENARMIMRQVYGQDDQQPVGELKEVRLRFAEDVESDYRQGISLFGRMIALASGRDSGAIMGNKVSFVVGTPESGGSAKHWKTIIPAGCEIIIRDVPESMLNSKLPQGVEII